MLGNAEVERIWRHPFLASAGIGDYGAYRGFHPADGRPYEPHEWPLARSLTTGEVVDGEEIDFERGDGTRGTMVVNSRPDPGPGRRGHRRGLHVRRHHRPHRGPPRDRTRRTRRSGAARAAAEAAGERLGRLQQVTAGLAEALTVEQVAAVMVRGGLSVAGCRSAWIGVLDDTGEALVVLAASFPVEPGGPAARIPLDAASPRAEVTRTGQSVWLPSAADALARYPGLKAIGIADGALGVVPLVSHGRPIGAMMLSFADERHLRRRRAGPDHHAGRAVRAGAGAGPAARARRTTWRWPCSRACCPARCRRWPGWTLAARYLPGGRLAARSAGTGTTWSRCPTAGSRSPSATWSAAVSAPPPRWASCAARWRRWRCPTARRPRVLDGLERFARQVEGARLATVAYGVLDPVGGTLRVRLRRPPAAAGAARRTADHAAPGGRPVAAAVRAAARRSPGRGRRARWCWSRATGC